MIRVVHLQGKTARRKREEGLPDGRWARHVVPLQGNGKTKVGGLAAALQKKPRKEAGLPFGRLRLKRTRHYIKKEPVMR